MSTEPRPWRKADASARWRRSHALHGGSSGLRRGPAVLRATRETSWRLAFRRAMWSTTTKVRDVPCLERWREAPRTVPLGLNTNPEVKDMLSCPVSARSLVSRTSREPPGILSARHDPRMQPSGRCDRPQRMRKPSDGRPSLLEWRGRKRSALAPSSRY